jgi:hypothetical protein
MFRAAGPDVDVWVVPDLGVALVQPTLADLWGAL